MNIVVYTNYYLGPMKASRPLVVPWESIQINLEVWNDGKVEAANILNRAISLVNNNNNIITHTQ